MGKIIAVVSGKGGTGKTSFTANVGIALAEMGYRTLCVDCDITLRNLDLALGLSDSAMMDFCDVAKGRCSLSEATVAHHKYTKLHLLTAPQTADALEVSQGQMRRLASAFDWPPSVLIAWWWLPPPTHPLCGTPSAP